LASGMNVNSLRTNSTLRKDEWVELDRAVISAAQDRLVVVKDLLGRGLRYTLTNGLGKTVLESENVSDMRAAEVSMDGVTRGQDDVVEYGIVGLPLPLFHKEYTLSIRHLAASRNVGESLDTTQARLASRKVADLQEEVVANGYDDFKYSDYTIYGLTDFTSRNIGTLSADWALSGTTGATIVSDVLSMKADALGAKMYGPYMLYISSDYETKMDEDYSTSKGNNTIRERILAISGIVDVKVCDKFAAGTVVLVQLTEDVIRMVEGLPLTNVEWETQGGMITHMKVMTISVPQIRTDQDGNCGVVHYSKA
jgi:uncharacterized linocin/CFP29 family protein